MKHPWQISLLVTVGLIVFAFVAYIGWESYTQGLAVSKVPDVIAMYNEVRQVPGAQPKGERSVSAHEYAVTVLWQSYSGDIRCDKLREHFDPEAARLGFQVFTEYGPADARVVDYRKDEYEIRVLCLEDGYSFSVNWHGSGR